jgi:hypothetical protein
VTLQSGLPAVRDRFPHRPAAARPARPHNVLSAAREAADGMVGRQVLDLLAALV